MDSPRQCIFDAMLARTLPSTEEKIPSKTTTLHFLKRHEWGLCLSFSNPPNAVEISPLQKRRRTMPIPLENTQNPAVTSQRASHF